MSPASRRLRGAADRRAAERRGTPPARPARGARAQRRRRKPGMTQPSCVSDGESHLRTPHVSSFGAEACAAAASARPTSSHPRAELIIALASNRPWPWPARGALACCACGPAARVGLVSAGREASADRPPERPAPGAADPLLRTVEEPPPVRGRWHSSHTPPSARPSLGLARALLSARPPPHLGSQVRALADEETRPAARLPVRAAAPPPPRARVTAQPRRRHDDEIRQTSSYPCLTALLRRSILRVSRPSPPPSALARPAPDVARTTRPRPTLPGAGSPTSRRCSARRPRHRRLGAPPPRRHARPPRPARGRCIPFAVTPLVRA